jgi:hypothetical protein
MVVIVYLKVLLQNSIQMKSGQGPTKGCRAMDGWMGGWVDGWMGGWVGGWTDGQTDRQTDR